MEIRQLADRAEAHWKSRKHRERSAQRRADIRNHLARPQTFGVEEASRRTGVPVRTLQRWRDAGRIRASGEPVGNRHRYTAHDLLAIITVKVKRRGIRLRLGG